MLQVKPWGLGGFPQVSAMALSLPEPTAFSQKNGPDAKMSWFGNEVLFSAGVWACA